MTCRSAKQRRDDRREWRRHFAHADAVSAMRSDPMEFARKLDDLLSELAQIGLVQQRQLTVDLSSFGVDVTLLEYRK
jgi:hypothetical protein